MRTQSFYLRCLYSTYSGVAVGDGVKHLDLFSGIGGFALAARNVGWETVGFCEIDPYCQKVLAKHWPDVPIYEDVKDVTAERLRQTVFWPTPKASDADREIRGELNHMAKGARHHAAHLAQNVGHPTGRPSWATGNKYCYYRRLPLPRHQSRRQASRH